MAMAQISNSLCHYTSIRDVFVLSTARVSSNVGFSRKFGTAFATGSSILIQRPRQRNHATKATSVSIRCEQSTKDNNGLDVWLGRLAMVGSATAISIEIATGKELLEAPLLIIQKPDGQKYLKANIEPAQIVPWLKDYLDGLLKPFIRSEPIPEVHDEHVKVVVTDSLQDMVSNFGKNETRITQNICRTNMESKSKWAVIERGSLKLAEIASRNGDSN